MNINKISKNTDKVIEFVNTLDLRLDEKMAVLGSAKMMLNEIMVAESTTAMMFQAMKNMED